jgi:hypothetical protein
VVSFRLQTSLREVELFSVIATLDVTAAKLSIETFLPMVDSAPDGRSDGQRSEYPLGSQSVQPSASRLARPR